MGQIDLTDNSGNPNGSINPNEFVLTGAYALKLSETNLTAQKLSRMTASLIY